MDDPRAQPQPMGIDPGDMQRPAGPVQNYGNGPDGYPDQQGYPGGQAGGQDYADPDPAMGYDMAPGYELAEKKVMQMPCTRPTALNRF